MNPNTVLMLFGTYLSINKFLDDFSNWTMYQTDHYNGDYKNVFAHGEHQIISFCVVLRDTKFMRIDEAATRHGVAYCGLDGTLGHVAPSNTMRMTTQKAVTDALIKLGAL
jgi:hypothetical protein